MERARRGRAPCAACSSCSSRRPTSRRAGRSSWNRCPLGRSARSRSPTRWSSRSACACSSSAPSSTSSFDDGPHPVHTRRILETLEAHGAKASFFVIGEKAARNPELLREIVARGHELALHSWSHDRHLYLRDPAAIARELERSIEVVERATGARPTLFRPPIGFSTPRTRAAVRWLGLRVAGWSVRAFDGVASASSRAVVQRVARRLEPGAIVLLHDAAERGEREPASVEALPAILAAIGERGLRCVTVSELTSTPDEVRSSGVAKARAAAA
jgi:peptidoglycan/xylan/chitin deacetylase (PgdA/CDA1 family)